jgi:hypothetical protein
MSNASKQFEQLPMFMSAHEIRHQYQALDADREEHEYDDPTDNDYENDHELFNRKYDEAENDYDHEPNEHRSLKDAVLKDGVRNPISLQADAKKVGLDGKPEILGGHHRVAVMYEHKPNNLMPVAHFNTTGEARRSLGKNY